MVKNKASSIAESPPPTTATVFSLKKKPSQVAQAETPYPCNSSSPSTPSHLADAPEAIITDLNKYSPLELVSLKPLSNFSMESIVSVLICVPNLSACPLKTCINSGPIMPSTKPG